VTLFTSHIKEIHALCYGIDYILMLLSYKVHDNEDLRSLIIIFIFL